MVEFGKHLNIMPQFELFVISYNLVDVLVNQSVLGDINLYLFNSPSVTD